MNLVQETVLEGVVSLARRIFDPLVRRRGGVGTSGGGDTGVRHVLEGGDPTWFEEVQSCGRELWRFLCFHWPPKPARYRSRRDSRGKKTTSKDAEP